MLSPAQVDEVMRASSMSGLPSVSALIAAAMRRNDLVESDRHHRNGDGASALDALTDRRLSRSLLRGLSILTRFGPDQQERGILELSRELGMSASTTHRYALTLVELGLLERCPTTRKYRLPVGARAA